MKRFSITGIAALTAGTLLAAPAYADTSGDDPNDHGRVVVQSSGSADAEYSDRDVVALLAAGQGRIARDQPELLGQLGFAKDKPKTPEEPLRAFTTDLLAANPDFNRTVTKPLQSGDPVLVESALKEFSDAYIPLVKEAVNESSGSSAGKGEAQGWKWKATNVAAAVNAAVMANAVVYANAGVATNVAAGLVIVTWYLEDGSMGVSGLEREHATGVIADSLGR